MSIRIPRFAQLFSILAFGAVTLLANTAVEPVPRSDAWVKRHEGFVEEAKKGGIEVLFVGDSITDFWRRESPRGGKAVWDQKFAPLKAANFGISGDRTQHVLWRLRNGELDGISPKVVVLMIGTNNTGFEAKTTTPRNTVPEAVEGVTAVVNELRNKLPNTKILLLAIFPRGETPDTPERKQGEAINEQIAKLQDGKSVYYLDFAKKFLAPDGTLSKDIMPDFLHPNVNGYRIWADAIEEPLQKLLKSS